MLPDGPHSHLEFRLEHHVASIPTGCRPTADTTDSWRDERGRRHRAELQPAVADLHLADPEHWPHHGTRHRGHHIRLHANDPPPF